MINIVHNENNEAATTPLRELSTWGKTAPKK